MGEPSQKTKDAIDVCARIETADIYAQMVVKTFRENLRIMNCYYHRGIADAYHAVRAIEEKTPAGAGRNLLSDAQERILDVMEKAETRAKSDDLTVTAARLFKIDGEE